MLMATSLLWCPAVLMAILVCGACCNGMDSARPAGASDAVSASSTLLWSASFPTSACLELVVGGGVAFVETEDLFSEVTTWRAINASTSNPLYTLRQSAGISTRTLFDSGMFIGFNSSWDALVGVACVSGEIVWHYDFTGNAFLDFGPIISADVVVLGAPSMSAQVTLYGLSPTTGAVLWTLPNPYGRVTSAVGYVCLWNFTGLALFSMATGTPLPTLRGAPDTISNVFLNDQFVLILFDDGLQAFDIATGAARWQRNNSYVFETVNLYGDVFYVTEESLSNEYYLLAMNASTGEPLWAMLVNGPMSFQLLASDDNKSQILLLQSGVITALSTSTGAVLWAYPYTVTNSDVVQWDTSNNVISVTNLSGVTIISASSGNLMLSWTLAQPALSVVLKNSTLFAMDGSSVSAWQLQW